MHIFTFLGISVNVYIKMPIVLRFVSYLPNVSLKTETNPKCCVFYGKLFIFILVFLMYLAIGMNRGARITKFFFGRGKKLNLNI